jgi:REP element-mobilizing transposase RayT
MYSRTRGYLPHLEVSQGTYFLTFRLDDSLPAALLQKWKTELMLKKAHQQKAYLLDDEYETKIQSYLDTCSGNCWLRNPKIADIVANALRYFDGTRYVLHAWTIMPNHVHVLFTLIGANTLESVIHSWKSFTAHKANQLLNRTGRFWQPEYFDRSVKTTRQFEYCVRYILKNPIKAGLCKEFYQWPWSKTSIELEGMVERFFKFQEGSEDCGPEVRDP